MTLPYGISYSPPPEHLSDRISSLYEFSNPAPRHNDVERADRQQLRVMVQGTGRYIFANGHEVVAPRVALNGPTSGYVRQIGEGPILMVGAGLLPTAWNAMFGRDTSCHVDCSIDARQLWGDAVDGLWQAVTSASDRESRFAALCEFIADVTQPADPAHIAFIDAVDRWLTENADPQVQVLAAATGHNIRSLERLTKRFYGLPPNTLARKYRALRAAAALTRGDDLESIGMAHGFYDQSHLIREVKRFAGLTPQKIRARESQLTTAVALGRFGLRGKVSKLVSDA